MVHPIIVYVFWTVTGRSDRDNKQTTVQDALVNAGVLKDDNINDYNAKYIVWEAGYGKEFTSVFIAERGTDIARVFAHVEQTLAGSAFFEQLTKPQPKKRSKKDRIKLL